MAKVIAQHVAQARIELKTTLELDEMEVRALDGLFGYNVENFLAEFKRCMGSAYVQPFEAGVRSLHATIRRELAGPIDAVNKARTELARGQQMYAEAMRAARESTTTAPQAVTPPAKPRVKVPAGSTPKTKKP